MTPEEKMPTILMDLLYIAGRIELAKALAREANQRSIWGELDFAETRIRSLSAFIGPFPPEGLAEATGPANDDPTTREASARKPTTRSSGHSKRP